MSDTTPVKSSTYHNANVDETALAASLEGIEELGHYFEVVYETKKTIFLPMDLFPAIRVIFRSLTYAIARVYIGAQVHSQSQQDAISALYRAEEIIDYARVYPKGWGE